MKIAVCPGSFDPITLGHLDIIERASELFDKVIVLVMSNSAKHSAFTVEERIELISKCITNEKIVVDTFDGLLVDYAKEKGAVAIVKGLRAMSDFDNEFQQALINKSLYPEIETVFLTARGENMFLSSSMVKEVCRLGGDVSPYVPKDIVKDIYLRCKGEN
jgi:pantetheine-phosphate adenylyltransferase